MNQEGGLYQTPEPDHAGTLIMDFSLWNGDKQIARF